MTFFDTFLVKVTENSGGMGRDSLQIISLSFDLRRHDGNSSDPFD